MSRSWRMSLLTLLALSKSRPWEPLLVLLSVTLAAAGLSAVTLINEGAGKGKLASADSAFAGNYQVTARDEMQPLQQADYAALRRQGFAELVAVARHTLPVSCDTGSEATNLNIVAVDTFALATRVSSNPAQQLGAVPEARAIVSPATWRALQCSDEALMVNQSLRLTRIITDAAAPPRTVLVDIATFYQPPHTLTDYPLTSLEFLTKDNDAQLDRLRQALPSHLSLLPPQPTANTGSLSDSFQLNLWAMGMLMAVVCLFIIANALHLMYRARLPTLIQLRQLGIGVRILGLALLGEMVGLAIFGSTLGVIGGAWLTRALTPTLQDTFSSLFGVGFFGPDALIPALLLKGWAISALAITLVSLLPLRRLNQQLIMRSTPVTGLTSGLRLLFTLVLIILCTVATALPWSAFTALLSVVVLLTSGCGMVLMWLPILLNRIRQLVPARFPLAQWSIASACELSQRTRLAVCAFFIALTANTGMNVMTDSFRQATADWLTQRLVAPVYAYTESLPDEQGKPAGARVYPGYRQRLELKQGPVVARAYYPQSPFIQAMVFNSTSDNAWQAFSYGQGVFISQQLAFRQGMTLGDSLTIDHPDLATRSSLKVVAIYPDYGNPESQLLLPPQAFTAKASQFASVVAATPAPDDPQYSALEAWLASQESNVRIYDREQLISLSMQTFDDTFVVTDALNIATLLVAGLSFLLSVSLLTMDSQPQFSLIRSLGVSASALKRALSAQYLLLCLGTIALALPFGILLAWTFIERVNRFAFAWVYPLKIELPVLLGSALASLLVVSLFLLIPIGRLNARADLSNEAPL
ncbi:hypothetical protein OCL06_13730 [Alteromonas sp. ASW11-19]|uniref:ABC3 transporter permease C-terminal domain-containing protein n=1 Tax=Alteromonas salexigens TaxID=2982530 RepID=A0ABT2VQR7_9ALTE|nr:FtsX-like permease family protein [Alteromonas salexigens]MCU7555651.1 hypothetical protein [Alteromonas salexigens]